MNYKVGQPVKYVGEKTAYVQEFGPKGGAPVERGIIADVGSDTLIAVWWEYCSGTLYNYPNEIADVSDGPTDKEN